MAYGPFVNCSAKNILEYKVASPVPCKEGVVVNVLFVGVLNIV